MEVDSGADRRKKEFTKELRKIEDFKHVDDARKKKGETLGVSGGGVTRGTSIIRKRSREEREIGTCVLCCSWLREALEWRMLLLKTFNSEKGRWRMAKGTRRSQEMVGMQEENEERCQAQAKSKDRSEMRKLPKKMRCTLLNGQDPRTCERNSQGTDPSTSGRGRKDQDQSSSEGVCGRSER